MTKRNIPFRLIPMVGDEELSEEITGEIPVLLADDPKDDECDSWICEPKHWTAIKRLSWGMTDAMERAAIKQARAWLTAEQAEAQVERAMSREEER